MDLLHKTAAAITSLDKTAMLAMQKRLDNLTKPKNSLGKLEQVACQIAGICHDPYPEITPKAAVLMAADHGVAAQKVSAYPQEVTVQMLMNFAGGGAAMNVLMEQLGGRLYIIDIGVAHNFPPHAAIIDRKIRRGTADISQGPAMSKKEAVTAIEVGIEMARQAVLDGAQMIAIGEMGIANTTSTAAIACFYTGLAPQEVVGRGTGIDDECLQNKINAVSRALQLNRFGKEDSLDVLAQMGGLEIAGLCGVILGTAAAQKPLILDGFISSAAAICACQLAPLAKNYIIGSHLSFETGHKAVLDYLQIEPLLFLDMRLGEGTGAALAMRIIDSVFLLLANMATFESAGVAEKI